MTLQLANGSLLGRWLVFLPTILLSLAVAVAVVLPGVMEAAAAALAAIESFPLSPYSRPQTTQ
jgi:hypothetical protein